MNPDTIVYDEGCVDLDGRLIRLTKGPVTVYLTKQGTRTRFTITDIQKPS